MEEKKIRNIFVEGAILSQKIADSIQNHATNTTIGAHSIFLGQVRADENDGKNVVSIEYTTYLEMALEKMYEIRERIFAKYELTCMHVYHSLGNVKVGEICLFVFTSSKHRKMATEACSELVEAIKYELPIWGKEIYQDQSIVWKENKSYGEHHT
jgi:molybdopterin synthase catalytic subunit